MDDAPERLRSNEFWGKRSGTRYKDGTLAFPGRRGSLNAKIGGNSGPSGKRKLRWYQGRVLAKPGLKKK